MRKVLLFLFFTLSLFLNSQTISGEELLNKAIEYHDPNSNWSHFKDSFTVTMESPDKPKRISTITIDLPNSFFKMEVQLGENHWSSTLDQENCELRFNETDRITPEIEKEYRLNCDSAWRYRDYYTYLYGLPMKLKDPGTRIDPQVVEKTIANKTYWVLKVTYDPEVGTDTWYFYFDQKTFALKRYQFFHDESKNDGEYIILQKEIELSEIRIPKNRSWYFNADYTFLGTDLLTK